MRPHAIVLALTVVAACSDSERPKPTPDASTRADAGSADASPPLDAGDADAGAIDAGETWPPGKPIVILMIGDGMGKSHVEAAGYFARGAVGMLTMEQLPSRGELVTGSLSGLTDSAASATAMATGVKTYNGRMAMDRDAQTALPTLVELAHERGMAAGFVTTSPVSHGTPGAFTSHVASRDDFLSVADGQAQMAPEVMMGGGVNAFLPSTHPDSARSDQGLIAGMEAAGYTFVYDRDSMLGAPSTDKLAGLFARIHMTYVADRGLGSPEPTLAEMTQKALEVLDRNETGFFLMIEGARIDSASHNNDLRRAILETVAFDEAVSVAVEFASANPNVTLIVTADHECGGLDVLAPAAMGELPSATWRWVEHTNENVPVYAMGPGASIFHDAILPNTWVHSVAKARLMQAEITPPAPMLVPDGHLFELRTQVVMQSANTDFEAGLNQLDALRVDADDFGLSVGLEGLFQFDSNAVVLLVDVDYGAGTGLASLAGALSDHSGRLDSIISALPLTEPGLAGFGVDFVAGAFGGFNAPELGVYDEVGLRGLRAPFGDPASLRAYALPAAFGEGVRLRQAGAPRAGQGWELTLPWSTIYPDAPSLVPANAKLAIAAVLVSSDGSVLSNQALPPWSSPTTMLPGVVEVEVDTDGDGRPDVPLVARVLP